MCERRVSSWWALSLVTVVLLVVGPVVRGDEFEEVFRWKLFDFNNSQAVNEDSDGVFFPDAMVGAMDESMGVNESSVPYHNLPMGVTHHKGRLFITVPRRRVGIPATLNVIVLDQVPKGDRSPKLTAYPNFMTNELKHSYEPDPKRLISVYRTRVDRCDRMWFVDTGFLEYPDQKRQVQRPALWVIDLLQDRMVRRFEIPETIVPNGYGMASVTIDVASGDDCDDAYAYIPDLAFYRLYVYGFRENRLWTFQHEFLSFDPRMTGFNVAGVHFRWNDGIFSLALGPNEPETGGRTVYFHAMASTSEYRTSTRVLRNETLANAGGYDQLFTHLGERGIKTQCTIHQYDPQTGVLFYAEVNRNSIGCWNTADRFDPEHHGIVHLDNKRFIYPSDMTLDSDGELWVMTNGLPRWLYASLDADDYNFRVWRQKPVKAIAGTICGLGA